MKPKHIPDRHPPDPFTRPVGVFLDRGAAPFRTRDALAGGVSEDVLRGSRFVAPFHGVRVPSALGDMLPVRAAAALLVLPAGAVLSCHTAAALRRLPVPAATEIHVAVPEGRASRSKGIHAHVRAVNTVDLDGFPVCDPAEMFLGLSEHLSLTDLVVVGDALLRPGWYKLEVLQDAVDVVTRRRGIIRARRALQLVRARVDSPMETRSRLVLVLAGLPTPVTGYRVMVDGQVIGWVDMAFPEYKIAIEYDGDLHRTLKKKWRLDIATREELRDNGWAVIVLTWDNYAAKPVHTVERVARELARRGCPDVPTAWRDGVVDPRTLSREWHAAFPGRARRAWDWADAPSS